MSKLKKYTRITFLFLVLSLIALFLSFLALTDINHGEENLVSEWTIIRIAALIFLAFIISKALTIKQIFNMDRFSKFVPPVVGSRGVVLMTEDQ